jgi:hypothetical protein
MIRYVILLKEEIVLVVNKKSITDSTYFMDKNYKIYKKN